MRLAIAALLALAAVILSAVALSRGVQLSLPLPSALPILNIAIPCVAALVYPLSRQLSPRLKQKAFHVLLPYLAGAANLAPFTLFILSLVFAVPSDITYCAADRHWLRLFELKDEVAVRSLQNRLQCCGYNSPRDRAWPFPSRTSDAGACERTQGYHRACGNLWRHEEGLAAVLSAVSSLLNWAVLVTLAAHIPTLGTQHVRPAWARPQSLIEGHADPEPRRENSEESHMDERQYHDSSIWNNVSSGDH